MLFKSKFSASRNCDYQETAHSALASKKSVAQSVSLRDQLNVFFGNHRCGWAYAVNSLASLSNPNGIYLDTFIEKTFCWSKKRAKAHSQPWIGIIHVPPHVPEWFQYHQSNQSLFESQAWQESRPYCCGLFTLTAYHRKFLQPKFDFPVQNLIHPTEIPDQLWSWEMFQRNTNKRIVQLGMWLRKLHAIYQLPVSPYQKTLILTSKRSYLKKLFRKEKKLLVATGEFHKRMYKTVETIDYLENSQYDRLLSENIIFLDLYDASANNTIIECIARGTPLLVNPVPPVVEYLGEEYPFYYSSYNEAVKKAADNKLIRQTHDYLLCCPIRKKLSGEYFKQSIQNSQLLQDAYLKIDTGQSQLKIA